jgi:hypothetical protein
MAISNKVVRGGGRNRGAVSAEVTKSSRPIFCLCAGARAISMVAATRAGVDRFWLTGARDEGGSGDTVDSEVSPGHVWRLLKHACGPQFRCNP